MHPHLAARCGVLAPALKNAELRGFIERLVELLVRYHDEDPRTVLARVPLSPNGRVRGVLLTVQQAGGFSRPDAYLSEATAARVVEDAILSLDRRTLELRLGELQARMAEADATADHGERKRLLAEQAALVDAVKALGSARQAPPARPVLDVAGSVADVSPDAPGAAMGAEPATPAAPTPGALPTRDDGPVAPPEPPWAGEPDDDPFAV